MSRWNTILAIDADQKAIEVYRANMPGVEARCEDIAFARLPRADVLLGGPPCQPFSVAGKRAGAEDSRDCVPFFIRAIGEVQPRMFLMEQVPGFVSFEGGRYMQRCVAAMEAHGYEVEMRMLNAVHFGVPQERLRAWFWGVRKGLKMTRCWPAPTHAWPVAEGDCMFEGDLPPAVTTGQALGLGGAIRRARGASVERPDHPATEPCPTIGDGGAEGLVHIDTKQKRTRRSLAVPAPALGGDSRHALTVRRLTPDECARLQSVPDDFAWPAGVAKTHRYRIIGNGWACLLAMRMGEAFALSDPASETVVDLFCGGGLGSVGWHGRALDVLA